MMVNFIEISHHEKYGDNGDIVWDVIMGYHGDKLFDVGNLTKYIMGEKHAMFSS